MNPYERWTLPELVNMLEMDSEWSHQVHLDAWRSKKALLEAERDRLGNLAGQLEAHWDPTKSEAARSFIGTLKDMAAQIQFAVTAVEATANMHQGITGVLTRTKAELQQLHASYNDSSAAIRTYNRNSPFLPDFLGDDTLPWLKDNALREHQKHLDQLARDLMVAGDEQVAKERATGISMPKMNPILAGQTYEPTDDGGTGDGASPPGSGAGSGSYLPPLSFVAPGQGMEETPMLAGGPSTATQPPPAVGPLAQLPTGGPFSPVMQPPLLPSSAGPRTHNSIIGDPGPSRRGPSRSGMPVQGVITAESTAAGAVRSGVPVPVSHGINGGRAMRGTAGGWQDRTFAQYAERRAGGRQRQGNEDDPWMVEEGVAPVLEAPRPPAGHDAGPGVIGLDR